MLCACRELQGFDLLCVYLIIVKTSNKFAWCLFFMLCVAVCRYMLPYWARFMRSVCLLSLARIPSLLRSSPSSAGMFSVKSVG